MIRKPAQAGRFYPAEPELLKKEVKRYIKENAEKQSVKGIVVPHAGYIYSGRAAGSVYSCITMKDNFIILGPNHTGLGPDTSIMCKGEWAMPNGNVKIKKELAEEILEGGNEIIEEDTSSHTHEHSIEVQIPFIQHFKKDFSIIPIAMRDYSPTTCSTISKAIAGAVNSFPSTLIIASSDMSHYEPRAAAEKKDRLAIEKILKLDPEGLLKVVTEEEISMCGAGPVAVMLFAAKALGARKSRLVFYNTSAEASGDYSAVVGYAGIIVM